VSADRCLKTINCRKIAHGHLAEELAELIGRIRNGEENLVEIPKSMLKGAIARIEQWKERKTVLERQRVKVDCDVQVAQDVEGRAAAAAQQLCNLGLSLSVEGTAADRTLLRENIEIIRLEFEEVPGIRGKTQSLLKRMTVVFRPTALLGADLGELYISRWTSSCKADLKNPSNPKDTECVELFPQVLLDQAVAGARTPEVVELSTNQIPLNMLPM
jgi:hypothetical protein